ncbi:MAG: amidase [Acidocella sp. 20-57-95]|nr:MAG: amidase [Acidocella sp. 20-57-95]OYV60499.1 MAG: amidase [Acidocella sp. 21-58-7]HQT62887.1 acetamidase/formamidase family protein [Acidocella sp.]HQU04757.1 acetamidase/formamidase family protein [Acidocella sp.]
MTTHHLPATPKTVRFGIFDASIPPSLTIQSGDTVVVETVSGGAPEMPESGFVIPPALAAIHHANLPQLGPHLITGPIAIAGALPGDTLEVRIEKIEIAADWGWCGIFPLLGTLPAEYLEKDISYIPVDRAANTAKLPWGPSLELSPFFGVMGVAPAPVYGALSSKEPRSHGGNLDNRELTAGSTLFLPVFVPGANFSAGDGHGIQGDGEVCVNALEICLNGMFTFILHQTTDPATAPLLYPRAETPTHYISMGMHEDLDQAVQIALREMINFICSRTHLTPIEAYKTCSLAVDFHVTQTVNGEKGVHGMLKKGWLF